MTLPDYLDEETIAKAIRHAREQLVARLRDENKFDQVSGAFEMSTAIAQLMADQLAYIRPAWAIEGGRAKFMHEACGTTDDVKPGWTDAQRTALATLCERYGVEFSEDHYLLNPFDLPAGYVSGWIGGPDAGKPTIYVGCAPNGDISS